MSCIKPIAVIILGSPVQQPLRLSSRIVISRFALFLFWGNLFLQRIKEDINWIDRRSSASPSLSLPLLDSLTTRDGLGVSECI
jgi:hypothetical protein